MRGAMDALPPGALPSWIQVGGKCRWWSESQQTHHPVVVTAIDEVKRRVVVHFVANHSVWKEVPFSQIGRGPLRPPGPEALDSGKPKRVLSVNEEEARVDGRATPPWYEQLNKAETRQEAVQEVKRKEESHVATQERRRYLWQQEQQRKAEEEHRRREEERHAREAAAEYERLRILEKLKKEREEEQLRQFEVLLMSKEDEVSSKANALWRQREDVARRQKEEEERQRFEEEHLLLAQKLEEERASRPRIAFGVKTRQDPVKASSPAIKVPMITEAPGHPGVVQGELSSLDVLQPRSLEELPEMSNSWDSWDTWSEPAKLPDTFPSVRPMQPLGQLSAQLQPEQSVQPVNPRHCLNFRSLKDWYVFQIRAVYQQHNPEKLADVPHLMQKYAGCEDEMYDRICEKYGVQPILPPRNLEPLPPPPPSQSKEPDLKAVGFARKASAPAPVRRHEVNQASQSKEQGDAPSTSDLLARFQNLVRDKPEGLSKGDHKAPPPQVRRQSADRWQSSRSPRPFPGGLHVTDCLQGASRGRSHDGQRSSGTVTSPIGARMRLPTPSGPEDNCKDSRGPPIPSRASSGRSVYPIGRAPQRSLSQPERERDLGSAAPPIGMRPVPTQQPDRAECIAAPRRRSPLPIGAPLRGSVGRCYRDRAAQELRSSGPGSRSRSPNYGRGSLHTLKADGAGTRSHGQWLR